LAPTHFAGEAALLKRLTAHRKAQKDPRKSEARVKYVYFRSEREDSREKFLKGGVNKLSAYSTYLHTYIHTNRR
jgi:hypothetical protein